MFNLEMVSNIQEGVSDLHAETVILCSCPSPSTDFGVL